MQIDVYRSDSFYATLASVSAAGMNNDGSISKYQFWKWFLKNVTFFQKYCLYHSLLKRHLYPDRTNYECVFFLKISARYIADSLLSSQKTSAELSQLKKKNKLHVHIKFNNSFIELATGGQQTSVSYKKIKKSFMLTSQYKIPYI